MLGKDGTPMQTNDSAPNVIPVIEGLDVKAGIALSGTWALYMKVLNIYSGVIERRARLLENFVAVSDIKGYTIEVHALKTASKLIGAADISKMAERLNECGLQGDMETIARENPALVAQYRALLPRLEKYRIVPKEVIEEDVETAVQLKTLDIIFEALDDFDINSAREQLEELRRYKLCEQGQAFRTRLYDAIELILYDDAMDIVTQWRMFLQ